MQAYIGESQAYLLSEVGWICLVLLYSLHFVLKYKKCLSSMGLKEGINKRTPPCCSIRLTSVPPRLCPSTPALFRVSVIWQLVACMRTKQTNWSVKHRMRIVGINFSLVVRLRQHCGDPGSHCLPYSRWCRWEGKESCGWTPPARLSGWGLNLVPLIIRGLSKVILY